MTALYAILAIICIGGILVGAYLIGFDDGVKAGGYGEASTSSISMSRLTMKSDTP